MKNKKLQLIGSLFLFNFFSLLSNASTAAAHFGLNSNLCFLALKGAIPLEEAGRAWPKFLAAAQANADQGLNGGVPSAVPFILKGASDKPKLLSDLYWTVGKREIPPPKKGRNYPGRDQLTGKQYPSYKAHAFYETPAGSLRLSMRVDDSSMANPSYKPMTNMSVTVVDPHGNFTQSQLKGWMEALLKQSDILYQMKGAGIAGKGPRVKLNIEAVPYEGGMKYKVEVSKINARSDGAMRLFENIRNSLAGSGDITLTPLHDSLKPTHLSTADEVRRRFLAGDPELVAEPVLLDDPSAWDMPDEDADRSGRGRRDYRDRRRRNDD